MIIVEERLAELFNTLPTVDGFKIYFDSGNAKYLNRFLAGHFSDGKAPYPLIWMLETDEEHDREQNEVVKPLQLIICTRNENVNMYNPERWQTSYKNILVPVYDLVKDLLETSKISDIESKTIKVRKEPNYTKVDTAKKKDGKSPVIDIWDALFMACTVRINDFKLTCG